MCLARIEEPRQVEQYRFGGLLNKAIGASGTFERFLIGERGEDSGQPVEIRVERALLTVDLVKRNAANLLPAEANHLPRTVVCQRMDDSTDLIGLSANGSNRSSIGAA